MSYISQFSKSGHHNTFTPSPLRQSSSKQSMDRVFDREENAMSTGSTSRNKGQRILSSNPALSNRDISPKEKTGKAKKELLKRSVQKTDEQSKSSGDIDKLNISPGDVCTAMFLTIFTLLSRLFGSIEAASFVSICCILALAICTSEESE